MNTRKALLTMAAAALTGLNAYATDIVVKPGAYTIEKALQQAREARRLDKATDICLRLEAGTYNLNQPIIIRPEDNGTRIVADGNAVISGGVKISGWKKEGKYYVASVPDFNGRPLEFRQMWVNGKKAVRARDVEDFEDMFRIRNIEVGYNFDTRLLSRIKLQSLRVYANVQNPKTWSRSSGYTPEVGGGSTSFGIDSGGYPMPTVYTLGFNLSF